MKQTSVFFAVLVVLFVANAGANTRSAELTNPKSLEELKSYFGPLEHVTIDEHGYKTTHEFRWEPRINAFVVRITNPDGSHSWAKSLLAPRDVKMPHELGGAGSGFTLLPERPIYQTKSWEEVNKGFTFNGKGRVAMATSFYFSPSDDYFLHVKEYDQATGNFVDVMQPVQYATSANSVGLTVADITGDTIPDIIVGYDGGMTVFRGRLDGGYDQLPGQVGDDAYTLVAADFNKDGIKDILSVPWSRQPTLHISNGTGGFSSNKLVGMSVRGYNDAETGRDLNGDGIPDTGIMSGQGIGENIDAYTNDSTLSLIGSYTVPTSWLTTAIALGDYNGDGLADVALSNLGNSPTWIWIYYQNPGGTLDPPIQLVTYDIPESLETFTDCSGRDGLIVLHGGWNTIGVYEQLAVGGLGVEKRYAISYNTHYDPGSGLSVWDVSNDGVPDAMVAGYNDLSGFMFLEGSCCSLTPPDTLYAVKGGGAKRDVIFSWLPLSATTAAIQRVTRKLDIPSLPSPTQVCAGSSPCVAAGEVSGPPTSFFVPTGFCP